MIVPQRARVAAIGLAAGAGFVLCFLSAAGRLPPAAALALALGVPVAAALALAWRTRWRGLAVGLAAAALVAAAVFHAPLARHVGALWLAQHLAVHLLLAGVFLASLRPAAEPVATRIARAVLPAVSPAVAAYSRRVTAAWAIYFVAVALASALIYALAPAARWSAFAALTSGPLVALLFALEFAVRRRVLPARDCASIADTVRGFRALLRPGGAVAAPRSHG